jgi:uncharacterized protein (DUF1919 family)
MCYKITIYSHFQEQLSKNATNYSDAVRSHLHQEIANWEHRSKYISCDNLLKESNDQDNNNKKLAVLDQQIFPGIIVSKLKLRSVDHCIFIPGYYDLEHLDDSFEAGTQYTN